MNFASYDFWRTLFLCFVISRLIIALVGKYIPSAERDAGKLCLAATGLILLGSESWLTLCAFLWVVALSWLGVLLAGRNMFGMRTAFGTLTFVVLLLAQLAPLFYYKYWFFLLHGCLGLGVEKPSVLIPMGLSFYTFQKIGFWVDTIRKQAARPRFLDYLNFCSFFPQIVAGPIEKRESLLPQIQKINFKIQFKLLEPALRWIILGFAYKLIIADNLGLFEGKLRIDPSNAWHVWFESFSFGMRIYFDFAGYSFIAVGLGMLLGVHLTLNFRCPYWSSDLREFWRNWHVTLGAWLRDYVYLPLGGRKSRRWIINILIVFLVSGIWHGAGWGFIIWGALHGMGVAFCGIGKPWTRLGPFRWAFTFAYTTAAWLFFHERDGRLLQAKAMALLTPAGYGYTRMRNLMGVFGSDADAVTMGLILFASLVFLLIEWGDIRRKQEPYHTSRLPVVCLILAFLTVLFAPMEESPFIYFNF